MKILLLQDVKAVGKKGEVKNVADGHALNNLVPRKVAVVATSDVIKRYELEQKQRQEEEQLQSKLTQQTFADLADKTVNMKVNASDKGHLFASIHVAEILVATKEQLGLALSQQWVELKQPIKEVGVYKIKLHAHGVNGVLNVEVKG